MHSLTPTQSLNHPIRTSAASQLAQLCVKMICQTATPMTSTKDERLAQWLGSTELYPVTKTNWLVAANGMVSKQIDLGIDVAYEERCGDVMQILFMSTPTCSTMVLQLM